MSHRFHPSILREYDIRGIVGETLGADDATAVGRGFAAAVRAAGGGRVAVGRDGRTTSPMLEDALVRGLVAGGVDVVRIGVGPSPMLYYAEAVLGVDGGIQVTGSHNPADHNGFKMVLRHRPFWGADIAALAGGVVGEERGAGTVADAAVLPAYVDRLVQGDPVGAYRIGWDCGNGAAGPAVEALVGRLPGEHHLLFTEVDGRFPHHHPDPSEEANLADLRQLVAEKRLDFGVAFDGDGDRIGVVDSRGRVLFGDQILMLLVPALLAARPGATVIADVKASQALFDRVAALGGRPMMGRTGHSAIKSAMVETGAPLAGEMSGHIFFGDGYYGFDDALYAAVQLIRAVDAAGESLTALVDAMPALVSTPDLRVPVAETRKVAVVEEVRGRLAAAGVAVDTTDGVRVTTPDGWWLLRASNTQGAVTVRAEAADDAGLARLLAQVDAALGQSGVAR